MKYNILIFLFFILNSHAGAQFKEPNFSFSLMPTLGNRLISYKKNVSSGFKDSISRADGWRGAMGTGIMFGFKTNRTNRMYIGFQFHNFGFTRKKEDIRFMDTIHPGIGIMNDKSQTGNNYVDFKYRYMYLSIPFLMSKQISGKNMKSSTVHLLFGGSLSGLIKHDIRAKLHGFSAYGKKVFQLDDQESEAGLMNVNLHIGLRLENELYGKNTFIIVQPTLFAPVLTANHNVQRHHLFALALEIGIMYKPFVKQ